MRKGMGTGKGKGYRNIIGKDPAVHRMSAKGMKQPQRITNYGMLDRFAEVNKPKKILTEKQQINRNYENYIIDSIDATDYGLDVLPQTPKEKLQFLKDIFRQEYGWAIERYGEQKAFSEWLSGLPSSIDFPHMNYDIIQLAKRMGSLPKNATEKQEDRVLDNYWNFMTVKTFQAFRKYGVK